MPDSVSLRGIIQSFFELPMALNLADCCHSCAVSFSGPYLLRGLCWGGLEGSSQGLLSIKELSASHKAFEKPQLFGVFYGHFQLLLYFHLVIKTCISRPSGLTAGALLTAISEEQIALYKIHVSY